MVFEFKFFILFFYIFEKNEMYDYDVYDVFCKKVLNLGEIGYIIRMY